MPRNITVTFADGSTHVYQNAPDNVSPEQVSSRASKEFGKPVKALDGGRGTAPQKAAPTGRYQQSPQDAAKIYTNVRNDFILKQRGKTAQEQKRALARFDSDPRIQGIRQYAGMPTVRTRQEEIKDVGRRAAAKSKATPELAAMSAGIGKGLFGLPEHLGAASLTLPALTRKALPASLDWMVPGEDLPGDLSYGENLDMIRAKRDALMEKSPGWALTGELGGNLVGGIGAAKGLRSLGGAAAASSIPGAARAGNVLQKLTTLRKGKHIANAGKVALAGAVGGGAQAAGEGSDVTRGALLGGAAAPALHGLVRAGVGTAKGVRNLAGFEPVDEILAKYVQTPASEIQAAMEARARKGLPSSIYEVLPLADRQALDDAIGKMPGRSRERLASAVRERSVNMVRETNQAVQGSIRPVGPDKARATIASDLAKSRGPEELATPQDMALAERAARSPLDMEDVAAQEARNIMAPHDAKNAYDSLEGIIPQRPELQPDNSVKMIETDPEIGAAIRAAAGPLRIVDRPITVKDITSIMSNLSRTATRSPDDIQRGVAWRALDHIEQSLAHDHPEVLPAVQRMRSAYGSRMRMSEGVSEGAATRLRENVDPRGSDAASRNARNAYDTAEGSTGRALGQASQLEREILTSPDAALRTIGNIAENPTMQTAISRNIGREGVGENIASIAQMQAESARRLSGLDREAAQKSGGDAVHMLQNLMMLSPNTLPSTKAYALSRLVQGSYRIPEKQANVLVDMLFSQNPTQISRAISAINRMDARILPGLGQAIAVGSSMSGSENAYGDTSVAPVSEELPVEEAPAEATGEDQGMSPDEANSPYAPQLQEIYDTENPDLIDLVNRVSMQESRGQHFQPDGQPTQSSAGAIGVMQVMPQTAPEAARLAGLPWDEQAYRYDPAYNKMLGIAYLSEMLRRYDGDVQKALAAYNAGPGRLEQSVADNADNWLAGMPAETQDYVARIS